MYVLKYFLISVFLCLTAAEKVSFKNVTLHGYSSFTHKFKKTVLFSNSLKDEILKERFDAIEMKNQHIPVLYEGCISDIDQLDELILESNGIEEIQPGAMKNLQGIRKIILKGNELKTIKAGVFNDLPVSDLDLSLNSISVVEDKAFDNMLNLLNIRLTDNKISTWNKNWFSNTPLLTRVSFQHNLIEELPSEGFINMKGEKKFGTLPLKLNLIFSYNKIEKLHPDTFTGLKELNNLWLDNNLLHELPKDIFSGISIENLMIGHNKLTCVKDKESILTANSIDIDGNPLDCTCLSDIKSWGEKENKSISLFYSDMDCYADKLHKKINDINGLLKRMKNGNGNSNENEVKIV